jgi:hypothetical protein
MREPTHERYEIYKSGSRPLGRPEPSLRGPAFHAFPAALCTPRWSIAGQSVTERPLSFTVVLGGTRPTAGLADGGTTVFFAPPLASGVRGSQRRGRHRQRPP